MAETNNNCGMHEALVAYLYGEASAEETDQVQAHLTQCKKCTDELESFERMRGMLQQWQIDDLPVVRVAVDGSRRSFVSVLKELFALAPIWVKAAGAFAAALVLMAVVGTDIRIGKDGVSLRTDLLRRGGAVNIAGGTPIEAADIERVREDLRAFVNQLTTESERREKEALSARLVALESEWQNAHSADLAKLKTRIEEHRMKIRSLERDIDRREGTDLTDILFSELTNKSAAYASTSGGGR